MVEEVDDIGVISSVIVHARPEVLSGLSRRVEAMPCTEIHGDDPSGKLIVVIEADDDRVLTELIEQIRNMDGVFGVNMVFHHNESAPAADYKGSWRG